MVLRLSHPYVWKSVTFTPSGSKAWVQHTSRHSVLSLISRNVVCTDLVGTLNTWTTLPGTPRPLPQSLWPLFPEITCPSSLHGPRHLSQVNESTGFGPLSPGKKNMAHVGRSQADWTWQLVGSPPHSRRLDFPEKLPFLWWLTPALLFPILFFSGTAVKILAQLSSCRPNECLLGAPQLCCRAHFQLPVHTQATFT